MQEAMQGIQRGITASRYIEGVPAHPTISASLQETEVTVCVYFAENEVCQIIKRKHTRLTIAGQYDSVSYGSSVSTR